MEVKYIFRILEFAFFGVIIAILLLRPTEVVVNPNLNTNATVTPIFYPVFNNSFNLTLNATMYFPNTLVIYTPNLTIITYDRNVTTAYPNIVNISISQTMTANTTT